LIIIILYDYYLFYDFLGSTGEVESTEFIFRGPKGIFHRQQQNPRAVRKTNWFEVFKENHCAGSAEECSKLLNRFQTLNNRESKNEANGMLAVFIDQGAKETLLREVFGIGSGRYFIIELIRSVVGEMALQLIKICKISDRNVSCRDCKKEPGDDFLLRAH
jgi:hypothetical protein